MTSASPPRGRVLDRSDRVLLAACAALVVGSGLAHAVAAPAAVTFIASGLAVAALAALVGRSVEQLGDRLGAGGTGVLQSALGNLPELFIGLFALRSGLIRVVDAAIVGSVLSNLLLVLGLAFAVGGLRHGPQRFDARRARTLSALMLLAVAGMMVPSLASYVGTAAAGHEVALSRVAAVVLLAVFALSVPASLSRGAAAPPPGEPPRWPLWLAVAVLAGTGVLAAFVSDWFVAALSPALVTLHISQGFAGLVIVAIAGNAVENVVGVQLAARDAPDYAISVILNSPVQIALVLAPALVLLAPAVGGAAFTLVFPPLLASTLAAGTLVVAYVLVDGESVWLEGIALIALYVLVAASFWWG